MGREGPSRDGHGLFGTSEGRGAGERRAARASSVSPSGFFALSRSRPTFPPIPKSSVESIPSFYRNAKTFRILSESGRRRRFDPEIWRRKIPTPESAVGGRSRRRRRRQPTDEISSTKISRFLVRVQNLGSVVSLLHHSVHNDNVSRLLAES